MLNLFGRIICIGAIIAFITVVIIIMAYEFAILLGMFLIIGFFVTCGLWYFHRKEIKAHVCT